MYQALIVTPGVFKLPPAKAFVLAQPELMGLSAGGKFVSVRDESALPDPATLGAPLTLPSATRCFVPTLPADSEWEFADESLFATETPCALQCGESCMLYADQQTDLAYTQQVCAQAMHSCHDDECVAACGEPCVNRRGLYDVSTETIPARLSGGAIAGIVIGSIAYVALLAAAAVALVCVARRRRAAAAGAASGGDARLLETGATATTTTAASGTAASAGTTGVTRGGSAARNARRTRRGMQQRTGTAGGDFGGGEMRAVPQFVQPAAQAAPSGTRRASSRRTGGGSTAY